MDLKRIVFALVVLTMSATGFAADADNGASAAAVGKSSPSDAASYFQGVWTGKWAWGIDGVELTITVGKKFKNGLFGTTYSWGAGRSKGGQPINSGLIKAWGKEEGDRFLIEWKNKKGVRFSVTLVKGQEDSVKATYASDGPVAMTDSSQMTTYLHRK